MNEQEVDSLLGKEETMVNQRHRSTLVKRHERNIRRPRHHHLSIALLLLLCIPRIASKKIVKKPVHGLNSNGTCPLVVMLPFTDTRKGPPPKLQIDDNTKHYGRGIWPDVETLSQNTYALMAAAQLAADHFNDRDSSVVPQLADEEFQCGSCNVTLPEISYVDTSHRKTRAAQRFVEILQEIPLCMVVGPETSEAIEGISVLADAINIPNIDYGSIDKKLSRVGEFPALVRTLPKAEYFADAVGQYVGNTNLDRKYVAIIYDRSDYGEQFEDPLESLEDILDLELITESITDSIESIESALSVVQEDGYNTIMLIADEPMFLEHVANIADEKGLIGERNLWFISDGALPRSYFDQLRAEPDSPLDRLLRGSAIFRLLDPFMYQKEDDKFLASWRAQGSELVDRLNDLHPLKEDNPYQANYFVGEADYFQMHDPAPLASYIYDSLMLAGISACRLAPVVPRKLEFIVSRMLQTQFTGASGNVEFQDGRNGRSPDGLSTYGMYNVRHGDIDEDGLRSYDAVFTSLYNGSAWVSIEGTEFIYHDGTTNKPGPLRTTANPHYLSKGVHVLSMVLMALGMFIAFGSGLWIWFMRKNKKILASQPEFLYVLCFGSALVAASIGLQSWDESYGWSETKLSNACTAFPWCFYIGYLTIYGAIFSKLTRTNKVFSLRRKRVKIRQVILPFVVVIALSVIVLALWTIIDPLVWERVRINKYPLETYGRCNSTGVGAGAFIAPLMLLVVVMMVSLLIIVWRTKDIQNEFAESNWIFYGILTHLQTWIMALPIWFVLEDQSADARHLCVVIFLFIFSTSLVILIIWPKIFVWAQTKIYGDAAIGKPRAKVNLTGGNTTYVSGLESGGTSGYFSSSPNTQRDRISLERISLLESENNELKKELNTLKQGLSKLEDSALEGMFESSFVIRE